MRGGIEGWRERREASGVRTRLEGWEAGGGGEEDGMEGERLEGKERKTLYSLFSKCAI